MWGASWSSIETMEIIAEERVSPHPMVINGELVQSSAGLSDPVVNPRFFNHTKAYIRYCDGASFAGNVATPVVVNTTTIFFRGRKVLDAVIDALLDAVLLTVL